MVVAEAKGQAKYQIFSFKHVSEVFCFRNLTKPEATKTIPEARKHPSRQSNPFPGVLFVGCMRRPKDLSSVISVPEAA